VVDVAHDGHDRRAQLAGIGVVGLGDEAFLDVGFGHALDRHAVFLGHQFGGVGIDHVVDLHHQALTHQELDDVDAAHGHAVGQFADGDGVGNDHFTRTVGRFGRAAAALFLLAFASAAHRGQRAHALDGVLVASRHRVDGQAAFAALGLAARAADGLARRIVGETLVAVVLATARTGEAAAGAAGTGHLGLGRGLVGGRTRAGTGRAGRAGAGAGGRTRIQRRIADGLSRTRGTFAALAAAFARRLFTRLRTLAAAHGLFAGRTAAEGRTLQRRAAGRDLARALAEVDGGTLGRGRSGGLGRLGLGLDLGGLGLGRFSLRRFDLGRGRLGRRRRRSDGAQLGGLDARSLGRSLGGGGFSGGLGGGGLDGGGLFALGGLGGGLGGDSLAFALGGLLGRQGDGAATGLLLLGRQASARRLTRHGRTRRSAFRARTRDIEALRALMPALGAGAALGLDDDGLVAAVAEALFHRAGRDRTRRARLQAQRSARPRLRRRVGRSLAVVGIVVFVAHPVALLRAENSAFVSLNHP